MKLRLLPSLLFSFLLVGSFLSSSAQDLTGIWRGYFITDGYDQYKLEIQIDQKNKSALTGVSYSYLSTVFYGKATVTGYFNAASDKTMIQEIKTVELRMSSGSVACIMKYILEYSRSGKEEFLEGTYTSKYEKTYENAGVSKGENCGGGKVFLRKVTTSDFYVEPFLREKPIVKTEPKAKPNPVPKKTETKPVQKTTPKPPVVKKPEEPKRDTVQKRITPPLVKENVKKQESPKVTFTIPNVTRSRKNELAETIFIENEEVTIMLYDNGEIDDDTVSIYLNDKLVLGNKRLTASPITLSVKLDKNNPEQILVLVAENMGKIPPNTSLMLVYDGDKRHQVRITSTEQKNAMVRLRYRESED